MPQPTAAPYSPRMPAGGLVPGVEVYAYACHPVARRWGRAWLERGGIELRFLKPVYDGRIAAVRAREAAAGLELEVHSDGLLCAAGHAWLAVDQTQLVQPDDHAMNRRRSQTEKPHQV